MPIHNGRDHNGPYYQWSNNGNKYYYTSGDKVSRRSARSKAIKQAQAIYSSMR